MVFRYLKDTLKRMKNTFIPKHPHYSRSWMLPDGTIVVADSYDDTQFDIDDCQRVQGNADAPTVTDLVNSGELFKRSKGGLADVNMLTAAEFSERFLNAYEAAGLRPDIEPESETPVAETPIVETPKTE